jgi:hypothetical protein
MKCEERRGPKGDRGLLEASGTEEERSHCADQPIAQREVWRSLATTPKDDQLLLEDQILGDHPSDTTTATQPRPDDNEVEQG